MRSKINEVLKFLWENLLHYIEYIWELCRSWPTSHGEENQPNWDLAHQDPQADSDNIPQTQWVLLNDPDPSNAFLSPKESEWTENCKVLINRELLLNQNLHAQLSLNPLRIESIRKAIYRHYTDRGYDVYYLLNIYFGNMVIQLEKQKSKPLPKPKAKEEEPKIEEEMPKPRTMAAKA